MDKNITPETQLEMIKKEEQLFNKYFIYSLSVLFYSII